ncbi:thioester domain-containing protein [Allokutzneria albata]|uniref:LPXTG-motif cell wall anchor domain-containing protein/TQXA domain-containing protein n=1 Tax=Allokutzneria albata TaxID=211114 RepID=A0A1H0ADP3_ALLAB|nr:thioester domain-containing protein [Allokutzneria albata]SDN31605.1 LPXTG-motif cell wall anchor domain-containing protein/TQXA domain-containing protein [Allokutzneria albata]
MASGLRSARLGAVLLSTAAITLAVAGPAFAEAAKAKVNHSANVDGLHVKLTDGNSWHAKLLGVELEDGTKVKTYCVELTVNNVNGAPLVESPWEKYPDSSKGFKTQPDKVNWILHHSYPAVSNLAELAKAAGSGPLDEREAISGTQAAIWHFSNKVGLSDKPGDNPADVVALYKYLTGPKNVGMKNQPAPALNVEPAEKSGVAGKPVGPFKVNTTADKVNVEVKGDAGAKLVDAKGAAITSVANGGEVFVSVPADAKAGKATIDFSAKATLQKGRLFVGDGARTQTLILAQAENTKVKAKAKADWKAAPVVTTSPTPTSTVVPTTGPTTAPTTSTTPGNPDDLANTGASILFPAILGGVLVAGGATALVLQRKRKKA